MTIKIEISHFYDYRELKQLKKKQNRTFFHGTCSNLTPYLYLSKNTKVFQ